MDACVVISHESAARYWLSANLESHAAPQFAATNPVKRAFRTRSEILDHARCDILYGEGPLHVLVSDKRTMSRCSQLAFHVGSVRLPPRFFYRIDRYRYIVSPELCFVQMAKTLSAPKLIEFGAQLCARYYIRPEDGLLIQRHTSATDPARLGRSLKATTNMHGVRKAAAALPWVLGKAESPMEIKSALLLTLPYRLGGFGLPQPEVNREEPSEGRPGGVRQRHFRLDMCWPEHHVVVEYDGKESHQDAHSDKHRSNILEGQGWHVLYITKREINDTMRFEMLAQQVAQLIGHRLRRPGGWSQAHVQLRRELNLPQFWNCER